MKNIVMSENINALKQSIKDLTLTNGYEYFSVLIGTGKSYHVVSIVSNNCGDSFWISHPSYNFNFEDIEQFAILSME